MRTAKRGTTDTPVPASQPSFPLPHADDFEGVAESQEGKWLADQIGAFEVHPETGNKVKVHGVCMLCVCMPRWRGEGAGVVVEGRQ